MGKGGKEGAGTPQTEQGGGGGGGMGHTNYVGRGLWIGGTMEKEVKREEKDEVGMEEGQFHGCPPLSPST